MPKGKIKFYDPDKGFGFIHQTVDSAVDAIYFNSSALPGNITNLPPGTRVEFSESLTSRGAEALTVNILDPIKSIAKAKRRRPEETIIIIEDLIKMLDEVSEYMRKKKKYPSDKDLRRLSKLLEAASKDFAA